MSKTYSNRSAVAVAARGRTSAGPMKHRNQPRGGARNMSRDLLQDFIDDDTDDEIELPRWTSED